LLDNHTKTKTGKLIHGWKWENPPTQWWQSYHANYIILGSYNTREVPFYLLCQGGIRNSSMSLVGTEGNYWSSAASSSEKSYRLIYNSNLFPSASDHRNYGFSIRCLAR